jgi:feruloyl esterase
MKRFVLAAFMAAVILATVAGRAVAAPDPASCESLTALKLADTTITSATSVAVGAFTPPGASASAQPLILPAFCRVVATTKPAIQFEVWLPLQNWNGKFQGVGNGGMAGVISYAAMAAALKRGYATASTDTGHVSKGAFDASWALNHPELVVDFGYRGLHLTTVNGKEITRAFYSKQPEHSYYVGCSKGGQQGLMEAQRFPEDYDGLIAGDPANNWTHFYAGGHLWYVLATQKDPESYIPANKVPILADAVNAACDALDGVKDGVLNDPRMCKFDPVVLTCKVGQDPASCFTPKQVKAVKDIWAGPRDSSGQLIYPGLVPGGEAGPGGWAAWTTGSAPSTGLHWSSSDGFFKYIVFNDPNWDFRTFNYDTDMKLALQKAAPSLDATDPNLLPLKQRGAKLIVYHGWSDPDISPLNSINYYESVVSRVGGTKNREQALNKTQDFFRLFMVPGMQHCTGGPGPSSFDMVSALEQWVEHGVAPQQVIASHVANGVTDRTRPLCPYPQSARYNGTGSTDDAANFTCKAP